VDGSPSRLLDALPGLGFVDMVGIIGNSITRHGDWKFRFEIAAMASR
jgi:hypothetical protein